MPVKFIPLNNQRVVSYQIHKTHMCIYSIITSKRIELESPGHSGFEANLPSFKT